MRRMNWITCCVQSKWEVLGTSGLQALYHFQERFTDGMNDLYFMQLLF